MVKAKIYTQMNKLLKGYVAMDFTVQSKEMGIKYIAYNCSLRTSINKKFVALEKFIVSLLCNLSESFVENK